MTENAHLDYLRVACWDDRVALDLFAELRRWGSGWSPAKWLQYKGHRIGGLFYGVGEQSKKRHYVAECSGQLSEELFGLTGQSLKIYATRIDLQVTIPEPADFEPFAAYAEIKSLSKVKSSLIHSDDGSTIYIGARTGQKFARLYQKRLGQDKYLRLEFEIKGRLANVVYMQMREGISINTLFSHFLMKSKLPEQMKLWYDLEEDGDIFLQAERVHDQDKQLEWLSSLENTVIRMGNDHYQKPTVRGLLERWLRIIDKEGLNV